MKKFFKKFQYVIIVLLFITMIFIFFINYKNTTEIIEAKYNGRQELVENNILNTVNYINDAYKIAEKQLNQEMEEYSLMLKNKYRHNQDVLDWNLEQLKKEFNGYNIYIINRDLEIIKTTFEKDLGLDFKRNSGFSKILKKRLQGNSFVVDRLDIGINTPELKKCSYMPTPDHKYLLELSIDIKQKYPALKSLDIFSEAVDITKKYKIVEEISFYKINPNTKAVGKLCNTKKPYINTDISEAEKRFVRQAFLSNQPQIAIDQSEKSVCISKYFPALVSEQNVEDRWWNSYVVGISYNNQIMLEEINKHRSLFLINALIMVVVFVVFILIVIYLLKKFEYMAYHDQLTGLPNRKSFVEAFDKLLAAAEKNNDKLAVLFLDIDNFKEVNDHFGHDIGDKLLEEIAYRLKDSLQESDNISRLGGDEFTVAATEISSKEDVIKVAEKVIDVFKKPFIIENNKFFISVSVGISIYPEDGRQLEELIKKADYAMYKAKKQQKNYVLYEKEI